MTQGVLHRRTEISVWRLLAYGQMGAPLAALSLPLYVYLPAFYAKTLGLGLASVGGALLVARIWDLLTDPLVGVFSDRIGWRRNRRKKWIAAGSPILLAGLLFLFLPVDGAGILYLLLASFVFYLGTTMVMLPYLAWGAELASGYHERSRITGIREGFVVIGTLFAAAVPALFVDDMRTAMLVLGVGITVLLVPSVLVLIGATPDRDIARMPKWDWREAARIIYHNRAFRRLLSAYLLNGLANGLPATLFILFVGHRIGVPDATGQLLMLYFVCGIAGIPVWLALSRIINKHRAWSFAMILACASFLVVPFLGPGDSVIFAMICAISGICLGADLALPPSMQADIVAKDTTDTGAERAGLYFGLWNLATKLALALAVGIAFPLLEWSGFKVGAAKQPDFGLDMLAILYGGLPVVLKAIAIALIWNHRTRQSDRKPRGYHEKNSLSRSPSFRTINSKL